MRQGQHNKRARGRGRKPQNVNRTFESNGPDVKIRGTASTVAEKYLSLARDAQASGDPVASENYLQHAEHYFRIIAAAQAYAQSQNQTEQPGMMNGHGFEDDDEEFREGRQVSPGGQGLPHAINRPGERHGGEDREQASEGDDFSDGHGRRHRGRRGRRSMAGDGASAADAATGAGEQHTSADDANDSGETVPAEAG